MELERLSQTFSVCKAAKISDLPEGIFFISKTDNENSIVCETRYIPAGITVRDDNWRAFRVKGTLEFSLTGILSALSAVLAQNKIGIFAISTYDTDYILVKEKDFPHAEAVLCESGHTVSMI